MSSRGQPTVLADRYELGEVLGRGGMAEVRLARDRRLGRTVAVKMMRADLVDRADFVARFGKEARSVAALNHPTVVAVYDSGEARVPRVDGTDVVPYIVMEYVTGRTLGQVIDEGPVPVDQALSVTADVLTALEHAHAAGIVHRDIKPSNVMLTPTGAAKVMDFGIARVLSDATMTTTVVATPHYVSPEHAHGQRVDARSDLYSVGCMLFELLTGRPPFVAETSLAVVLQHLNDPPPLPSVVRPGLPPVLDRVVTKALAKECDDRYQTAAQFRADLEAVARGEEPATAGSGPSVPSLAASAPAVPAVVASALPGPGGEQAPVFQPTVANTALSPTAPDPVLGPTVLTPAFGPTVPQPPRVPVDLPPAPGAPVGQPGRTRRWVLVGALVLVCAVLVVGAVVWWPRGDGTAQDAPTGVAQDEDVLDPGGQDPQDDSPADTTPGDQHTGNDDPGDPGHGGTVSADDLEKRLAPPGAGSPSRQEQTIAGHASITLRYQSDDSVERLAGYYQAMLTGENGAYFDKDPSDGDWLARAESGGWTVSVTLTRKDSGTTVVVALNGTA